MLKGIYLTLLIGRKNPLPVPQRMIDALNGIQVTTNAGQRSGFQLMFVSGKNSVFENALSDGFFDPRTRVIVVVTLNGAPNVIMDGVIMELSMASGATPGESTLTITGDDVSAMLDLEHHRETHPQTDMDERVRKVLKNYSAYGLEPVVIPPKFKDVPSEKNRTPGQTMSDLAYIIELARSAGHVFYVEPGPTPGTNTAYWGPEVRTGSPQPALSINLDAQTNVESLNFTFDGRGKTEFTMTSTDPETREETTHPAPNMSLLRPPLAQKPPPTVEVRPVPQTARLTSGQVMLRGLAKAAQASDPLTASGQLDVLRYGGLLRARKLVSVRGAGVAFDGLYYVKSVTHNLKRGEYKQSFTLARDGLISNIRKVE